MRKNIFFAQTAQFFALAYAFLRRKSGSLLASLSLSLS